MELVLPEAVAQATTNAPSAASEKSSTPAPPPSSVGELQQLESSAPSSFGPNEVSYQIVISYLHTPTYRLNPFLLSIPFLFRWQTTGSGTTSW